MAAVLPVRPNTNSTVTSNSSGQSRAQRQPSLSSFPSNLQYNRTNSGSTQNDSVNYFHHSPLPASAHSHPAGFRPRIPNGTSKPARHGPVKSQYPADSTEKHVEYILVASFDIDRGSIMEHQYPGPVGGDEHMLAELMLPDQAHMRSQDWTVFFLHKDAVDDGGHGRRRRKKRKIVSEEQTTEGATEENAQGNDENDEDEYEYESDSEDDHAEPMDGPPLVYVLNLVNTKHDTTTRRGAVVKAMAICTRHSFLHIYKPLLLLALEQYFANPGIERLAELYDAVNSMDLSLMPRLSINERIVLHSSDAKDLFLEKFETMIAQRMSETEEENVIEHATQGSSSPPLPNRARYGLPRDTHEFETVVKYANVPVPVKIPTALSPETVGDFSLIKLITTFSTPHSTSPTPFQPTHPHLTTSGPLTHPIIVLLNALLTQKRVIFLGHNLPSSEVAHAVLGSCALASGGLLRGFTRHAFPYTDLTKIEDLLQVPGFIAGVTNPAFAHKTEWWDLLCDLSTGRMRISNRIENAPLTEGVVFFQHPHAASGGAAGGGGGGALASAGVGLTAGLGGTISAAQLANDATGDAAFMADVLKAIEERHGESAVRSRFRRWALKFTRLASAFEETVYGASSLHVQAPMTATPKVDFESPSAESPMRNMQSTYSFEELPPEVTGHGYVWPTPQARNIELAANATRIEGWRNTRSYYNFIQDMAAYYVHRPIKELDLQHLHDKLAKLRLGVEGSMNIYLAIAAAVNTDQEICQLLSTVCNEGGPGSQGQGLFYIAMGLFHAKREVREQIAELLLRIQEHEAGRHFWLGLGRFARMAWERVMQARQVRLAAMDDEDGQRDA